LNGPLVDPALTAELLTRSARWSDSHGASGEYLGVGLLYYTLVYATRAEVAVCLGSGGGFVPRLMRQAQHDLGTAHLSRTILVDGNVREAGWGTPDWLRPDSFFRRNFPDVEIVVERTSDAASDFFAAREIRIDYLHIDADHSFEGCLEDFHAYRPLLREGAVVTMHDTNFEPAGVRHVVDHLRGRPDCEVVDFHDLGAGTAIVRMTADGEPTQRNPALADAAVRVTRRPGAVLPEPPATEWKYLQTDAFTTRNVLAAHFVRDCETVVEIGGWRNPIDGFLTGPHRSVLVVDPFIRDAEREELGGRPCRVSHVRARFQDLAWQIVRPGEYGLVILGLEIEGLSDADYRVLRDLVERARTAVLELPTSWEASREQYERITGGADVRERARVLLDLSGNDFGDLTGSWPPRGERELHVLAGARTSAVHPSEPCL
jgi:hypothetical protein